MDIKIYFVIGSNGVGKTTTLNLLKESLSKDNYNIYDFDERGVPNNADKVWRKSETRYWLKLGEENIKLNRSTIICGFAKPEEIEEIANELSEKPVVIFLDADADTISERIKSRYLNEESINELFRTTSKSVEKFIMDNIYYSNILRETCIKYGYIILDTTGNTPQEVVNKVINQIQPKLK
jgi:thymidylate kinase